jgi:hypothetical protein
MEDKNSTKKEVEKIVGYNAGIAYYIRRKGARTVTQKITLVSLGGSIPIWETGNLGYGFILVIIIMDYYYY